MRYKIAIIEDDPVIRAELTTLLCGNGYEASAVTDFSAVAEAVRALRPHLILLDIRLPQASGFAVCSQIRSFSDAPIIFVTSSAAELDELNSILLGGDAFITKPYHTAILLAKIASLLKRAYPAQAHETLCCRGATLYLDSSRLEYNTQQVDLTKNEFKILYYLFKHAGAICARRDLIEYLWDNQLYVDDNALSVHVNRIRDKLAAIGLNDFIKTRHRQGYTL